MSIEGAVVPIMTFDFSGVNIDLLFAVLPLNSIPPTVDIDSDLVLRGVDLATEKSVNGPRVTNMIIQVLKDCNSSRCGELPLTFCVCCRNSWCHLSRHSFGSCAVSVYGPNCEAFTLTKWAIWVESIGVSW